MSSENLQYCRAIAPDWLHPVGHPDKVKEGLLTISGIKSLNNKGYNIYFTPNTSSIYSSGNLKGHQIDTFNWVFVDYDCKHNAYASKDAFIEACLDKVRHVPTRIIDSGNGIHVYWKVKDLDAKSFLRINRRLTRLLNTDEAVSKIMQLMRMPDTLNNKEKQNPKLCSVLFENTVSEYTSEQFDSVLPPISPADEDYCIRHYNQTYNVDQAAIIDESLPQRFGKLLSENSEIKTLFAGVGEDRSNDDFRLGHLLFAEGFTKDEATRVLVNTAKASSRSPSHRANYATNIVDKIWVYEETKDASILSPTVADILKRDENSLKGTRFPCHKLIDDTDHGFRLGQVMGIIGGSGVGKTTLTLNTFIWFAKHNPDYHHVFFSLEQPAGEIASRIKTICQGDTSLYDKIHIVSNYDDKDQYINFSISMIEDHILQLQKETGHKIGAVVIDHIGVLAKQTKNGENEGLIGICQKMKALAIKTNTYLIMLSQAPREKAGIGDLELDKSAAYGTVFFESFCDYCLCLWQPLKRVYQSGAPTIMAIKFAKIRHKKQGKDKIQEDIRYQLFFDPNTEKLREVTQDEEKSLVYYYNLAANLRKQDRKTEVVPYVSRRESDETTTAEVDSDRQTRRH